MGRPTNQEIIEKQQAEIVRLEGIIASGPEGTQKLMAALRENADLQTTIKEQQERLEIAAEEIENKNSYIGQLDDQKIAPYELGPTPDKNCTRYDGLKADPPEFVFHERIAFTGDSGYDASVLYDRAKGSVDRALGEDSLGRVGPGCSNCPPFSKANALEVIVRIVIP